MDVSLFEENLNKYTETYDRLRESYEKFKSSKPDEIVDGVLQEATPLVQQYLGTKGLHALVNNNVANIVEQLASGKTNLSNVADTVKDAVQSEVTDAIPGSTNILGNLSQSAETLSDRAGSAVNNGLDVLNSLESDVAIGSVAPDVLGTDLIATRSLLPTGSGEVVNYSEDAIRNQSRLSMDTIRRLTGVGDDTEQTASRAVDQAVGSVNTSADDIAASGESHLNDMARTATEAASDATEATEGVEGAVEGVEAASLASAGETAGLSLVVGAIASVIPSLIKAFEPHHQKPMPTPSVPVLQPGV